MATSSGYKGVSRVDHFKRNTHGWYVRVRYRGENYAKFFSDSIYKGANRALSHAVKWRDDTEKRIGKPRTDRVIIAAGPPSNTGVLGVQRTNKGVGGSFEVTWSPAPGKISRTSVSIQKWGEEKAFQKACAKRKEFEKKAFGGILK